MPCKSCVMVSMYLSIFGRRTATAVRASYYGSGYDNMRHLLDHTACLRNGDTNFISDSFSGFQLPFHMHHARETFVVARRIFLEAGETPFLFLLLFAPPSNPKAMGAGPFSFLLHRQCGVSAVSVLRVSHALILELEYT